LIIIFVGFSGSQVEPAGMVSVMIFRNEHKRSYLPKTFVALAICGSIFISGYLMFGEEAEMNSLFKPYHSNGDYVRNVLIISCMILYFLRLSATLLFFFQRKMYWIEAIIIANIMPWIFPYIAYSSGQYSKPVGLIEVGGILLFLSGSYLNTASEYLRFSWKQEAENAGRIYTGGLFKYAVNINYFGDIVLFTGLAAIAHQVELLIVPASMGLIFVLILIPLKEKYLKQKYGEAFVEYAAKTKKLIPLIY
jgi:protein-S-isoprenylcysteine O-methyltransferase Ste14